jgi:ABC-2 type transport system permease protein
MTNRMRRPGSGLRLLGHYLRFNLAAGMEYRASFITQVLGMVLNNASFIVFWLILFERLGDIRGYGFREVMFLWALSAVGYGLSGVFLGNAGGLSRTIMLGELDVYLLQPKPVLPSLLASRMSISAWGDILYGLVLYAVTQPIAIVPIALFLLFSVLFCLVLTSMRVLYHSLTFFLGNAEEFAGTASELVITFCLYPGSIFEGPATVVLHSLVPAALVAWIPIELFQSFSWARLGVLVGADALVVGAALLVFQLGLRRYESGNRIGARM